jgi:uncharacterized membrane protein
MSKQTLGARLSAMAERRVEIKTLAAEKYRQNIVGITELLIAPSLIALVVVVMQLTTMGAFGTPSTDTGMLQIWIGFIGGALIVGVAAAYLFYIQQILSLRLMRDEVTKISPLSDLKHFLKTGLTKRLIFVYFVTAVLMFLWNILPASTGTMAELIAQFGVLVVMNGGSYQGILAWAYLFRVLSWILSLVLFYKALGYSLAPLLTYDDDLLTARQALKKGLVTMKGHRFEAILAGLSYFWWFALPMAALIIALWISNVWVYVVLGIIFLLIWARIAPQIILVSAGYYDAWRQED